MLVKYQLQLGSFFMNTFYFFTVTQFFITAIPNYFLPDISELCDMQVLWLRHARGRVQIYKLRFNGVGSACEAPIVMQGAVLELPTYLPTNTKDLQKIHQDIIACFENGKIYFTKMFIGHYVKLNLSKVKKKVSNNSDYTTLNNQT